MKLCIGDKYLDYRRFFEGAAQSIIGATVRNFCVIVSKQSVGGSGRRPFHMGMAGVRQIGMDWLLRHGRACPGKPALRSEVVHHRNKSEDAYAVIMN